MTVIIETDRLILRTWKQEDESAYFAINQDPKVIEFLLGPLTKGQVVDFIASCNAHYAEYGYAFWAAELKQTGELIGFIGLSSVMFKSAFAPAVEIGWRLGSQYWGKGLATEGAKACLIYAINHCGLKEVVSFTVKENTRSVRVMEKIGLKRDSAGDFAHPKLATDHKLSRHILYKITV